VRTMTSGVTNSVANGVNAFLAPAVEYTARYFPPWLRLKVFPFDEPLSAHPYTQLFTGAMQVKLHEHADPIALATMEPAMDIRDNQFVGLKKAALRIMRGSNVTGVLHDSRHMPLLVEALEKSGCNDFFVLGMNPGTPGVKVGKYAERVDLRTHEYAGKVIPWLKTRNYGDAPGKVVGVHPLGTDFGYRIATETRSGFSEIDPLDPRYDEDVEGKNVLVTDSIFWPIWEETIADIKEVMLGKGAKSVRYVVEHGPYGHRLVDYAVHATNLI